MKVAIIGSGGREHALAWKISQSPQCDQLYAIPGNAGMADLAECVPQISATDIDAIVRFVQEQEIGFTIVGPEQPLVDGIDKLEHLIRNLAALKSLKVGSDVARPPLSALQVEGDMEIYLIGILDPVKEKAKLEKQKAQLEGSLENIKRKLSNPNFIRKAPPRVVESEQQRILEITSQLELVNQNLKSMN